MSFLNAALSSDEEDDDYRPELDKSAPKDERDEVAQLGKRSRDDEEEVEEHSTIEQMQEMDKHDPRKQAKKVKIGHLWELLNSKPGSTPAASASAPVSAAATPQPKAGEPDGKPAAGPSAAVSLAALCRTVGAKERKKMNTDLLWMRNLGLTPPSKPACGNGEAVAAVPGAQSQPSFNSWIAAADALKAHVGAAKASGSPRTTSAATGDTVPATSTQLDLQPSTSAAASPSAAKTVTDAPEVSRSVISEAAKMAAGAALAAAREGMGMSAVRQASKVTVTETRRFAGKDIQVTVQMDKDSKEAQKAADRAAKAAAPKSGLDAFLSEIEKKKKVNVLDKTKADWQQLKANDTTLEEELEAHKRSGDQYLDKRDFLKRAELREYEQERDKRLASDVRTRGRL